MKAKWVTREGNFPILALALAAAISLLVYIFAIVRPLPLPEAYLLGRLDGLYVYQNKPFNQVRLIAAFLLLGGLFLFGWWAVRRASGKLAWIIVLGGAGAFASVLLFLFPFDAADIFDNILHGRILSLYGDNPYVQLARDYPQDQFLPYMAWVRRPSAYGPLWEIMAGGAARLAGEGFVANVLVFKLLPGIFWLGSLGVIAALLRRVAPEEVLPGIYLLAWNPLVLYSIWGNGHNDIAMIFWVLVAAWAIIKEHFTTAILALLIGTLFKYIPVLLLPAALGIALRQISGSRFRFLVLTALIGAGIVWLSYLPFWNGPEILSIERRTQLFTSSLPAVVYNILLPKLGKDEAARLVSTIAATFTGLFALWRGWKASRDRNWASFLQASFDILVFYLLFTCLWFQQWYSVWIVAVAAALPYGGRQRLAVFFSLASLSKQMISGPILVKTRPRIEQPRMEILFTLGVLGLPWLYILALGLNQYVTKRKLSIRL